MNVTKDRFKNRQLHIEDYLQMVPAEQGEHAEVFGYRRLTENKDIITDFWTNQLMGLVLRKENLNRAYLKVKLNKGAGGIDGMQVDELLPYLKENQSELTRLDKLSLQYYNYRYITRVIIKKGVVTCRRKQKLQGI